MKARGSGVSGRMGRTHALERLQTLGLQGDDVSLAELIPAVEMAWADGEVQPNERAVLEAYAQSLVETLPAPPGGRRLTLARALAWLTQWTRRRLAPHERRQALESVRLLSAHPGGAAMRKRVVEWCEAVAAVDGSPVWDAREVLWLQRVRATLDLA